MATRTYRVLSLTLFVAPSLQAHEFRGVYTLLDEYAYANDQVFDQLTHPLTTRIANDLESTRTPANSQPPSTTESTTNFFGQRCGCGTGCEGEDGFVVVVFGEPLGMEKGDTSGCWSEYGALALS